MFFFWNLFFLTFHQQGVIWEKSVKGKLSVLLSSATGAFFPKNGNITFSHFFVTFCQFLTFLRQYNPCKELLVIRLEMICRTQIYFTSKNALNPWTSCRNNVSFAIHYPPPLYLEVSKVKAYIVRNANRQILRGRGRKLVFLQCFCIIFSNLFPPNTFYIKLDEPKMMLFSVHNSRGLYIAFICNIKT